MGLHIIDEANRCLNCKKPMCQKGCPVHTPIPHIIQMFKENQVMEAGKELFENNPMSVICSIVCNHEQQCVGNCVLGRKGTPVHFSSIENYISDTYLDRMEIPKVQKKGKKVAVIGAGPAGITAAVILAKAGYDVTIFEWKDKIGGIMQYGIPEFRLPKSILDRYQKRLLEMGIKIRPNTTIGAVLKIDDLLRDGYASIFVGTGVWKARNLGIHGECLGNVQFGIDYLANPSGYQLGENVAVIGMGNAAMDVARTALRNGARHVTLYARGTRAAASSHEISYAQLDGAEFVFGKEIRRITEKGPVFSNSILDENGKAIGFEEEEEQVEADSTIISISQGPRRKLIRTTVGLEGSDRGLLIVDENGMTTKPGVFAAGDVTTGSKTVVHAVEGAKIAAMGMIRYMEEN
ncbi:NAD(P)-dependent oxidoreductase [Blautia sp. MSJ-36]|uniref:NAD(P)-dependent oxidoreductase n=1 Tax=Blautia sp. MSJ-36 TaxID=2841530 RepID=UPI001C100A76|nr:NAD(P)-dependent oxidoreductase [Blautia sp. MSJ-36]MBU5446019.1 NAD(P)-dependent oxidoreductase [Blautia sp. MSJ-36]